MIYGNMKQPANSTTESGIARGLRLRFQNQIERRLGRAAEAGEAGAESDRRNILDSDIPPAKTLSTPSSDEYFSFFSRPLRPFDMAQDMLCGRYSEILVAASPR